jgi:hypothetical protein
MSRALGACTRGADWLLTRIEVDGSLRGATDLAAYYKTPCALLWSGHLKAARLVLGYTRERFLRAGGDLDGSGVAWFDQYRIYPHAWLACAAAELGDEELASQLTGFLISEWNPSSGGFRARSDGSEEIMTTSMAGLACLRTGEETAAAGVAKWLRCVLEAQPEIRQSLLHVWQPGKGLVRGDGSAAYRIDTSKSKQWYFQYGISAAFLAEYSRITGEGEALTLGRQYLHASAYCSSDVYRTPQSGKIGLGAAWTYRLSNDSADAALVYAVVDGLRALQCGDGSWNAEGVYEAKPTAGDAERFDVTAEFVALLAQMGAVTSV